MYPNPVNIVPQIEEKIIKKLFVILWYWLPPVIWMVILFYASSIRGEEIPKFNIPNVDKLFHFIEYFILGALLVRAFSNSTANPRYIYIFFASALIASLYGVTDEFHQRFVSGRSCELFDLLSDIIGSGAGAALITYKERIRSAVNKTV